MNPINWSPPNIWVSIAQLVEHCRANAEAMGSNPVEHLNFNCFHCCVACERRRISACVRRLLLRDPRLENVFRQSNSGILYVLFAVCRNGFTLTEKVLEMA